MVEKVITSSRNVVDFVRYHQDRKAAGNASGISARTCRYCGAVLLDGESADECSSAFNIEAQRLQRRFYAD